MAWINELLCLFRFAAFKALFYGLIYPEVNTGNWALESLRPIIHALPYNPWMDIPGRGTCKRSSAAVVQQSVLRWPANILQRKKSISGHWLGWLIWRSRHTAAQWSKKWEKGDCIGKKKLELKWEKAFSMVNRRFLHTALRNAACQQREAHQNKLLPFMSEFQ